MQKAELQTQTTRFFMCPNCGAEDFQVEHLIGENTSFGPWDCGHCNHDILGETRDGDVFLEHRPSKTYPALALLKLGDYYFAIKSYGDDPDGRIDNWDYLFHSHQCPTNLTKAIVKIYDDEHDDPHGIFRFMASIPGTKENEDKLEHASSVEQLLKLFNSDGFPLASEWPQEEKGVIPFLVGDRKEQQQ